MSELAKALAELQQHLPEVTRDQSAEVQTKTGGTFGYTYAGLANVTRELLPVLGALGLSFSARPTLTEDGKFVLEYELLHISGEKRVGMYPLPTSGTPQAIGGAITYARRYTLVAITGLAPDEDDDAASAEAEAQANRGSVRRSTPTRQATGAAGQPHGARPAAPAERPVRRHSGPLPPLPGEHLPEGQEGAAALKINDGQMRRMQAQFGELGIGDQDAKRKYAATVIRRALESAKDLTVAEASAVIEAQLADIDRLRVQRAENEAADRAAEGAQ